MMKIKPHANIVQAIEFISSKVYLYNIMEKAAGHELQQYMKENSLTPIKTQLIL